MERAADDACTARGQANRPTNSNGIAMKQVSMDALSAPLEEAVKAAGCDPRKAFKAELRKEPLTDEVWLVLLYELLKQKASQTAVA
jgi:hypothetical protein